MLTNQSLTKQLNIYLIENKTTHEDIYKINQMLKDELKKKLLIIFSKKPQNKNEIKTN